MPKGCYLSLERRAAIHRLCTQGHNQLFIFDVIFGNDESQITPSYLKNRIDFFLRGDIDAVVKYLSESDRCGGRLPKMDEGDDILLKEVIDTKNTKRLWSILRTYANAKGISEWDISITTVYRAQLRIRYSRKGLTRLHVRQNPIDGLAHFEAVAHIHEDLLLNFDAANTEAGENLKEHFGRGEKGLRAEKREIYIRGVPMCFVVLYSSIGFLDWIFFEGTGVDNRDIQKFLYKCVQPFCTSETLLLCDNASNNKHPSTIAVLENISHGNYKFNAAYQHYFAPVERGLSNVLAEIRLHEDDALCSTVYIAQQAFLKYSCVGTHGHVGKQSLVCS
jgi:hypothetical protein